MRRLYVLRHAKSSWVDASLADRDRPLAPRGKRDARLLAAHLRRERITPTLILCSSALRARATLAAIIPALGGGTELRIEDGLYAATAPELLERLRALPGPLPSVMLIGHNPGLHELMLKLIRDGTKLEELRERFATGTLATLALPIEAWQELVEGEAELENLVVARRLE